MRKFASFSSSVSVLRRYWLSTSVDCVLVKPRSYLDGIAGRVQER
jgi:hypothetical protein